MPQQIDVPGLGVVEFPDGMSDVQITAAIQKNAPTTAPAQQPKRGMVDNLFGLTGPRMQTWPEKSIREVASIPQRAAEAAMSAPAGSRDATEAMLPVTTQAAAVLSPLAPRVGLSKAAAPTIEELKAAATSGYDAAKASGLDIKPQSVVNSISGLRSTLEKDGINGELAPKTFSILSKLQSAPADSIVTVGNLDTLRRSLGHAAGDFTNKTEQMAARRAIEHLDTYLADIPKSDVLRGDPSQVSKLLGDARGNYSAAKRAEQIADAVEAADLSAAAANSGRNIGNSERQKFKSIALSDKKSSGYSPEELAQLETIIRGTGPGNAARSVSNFMGSGGGLGHMLTTAAGASAGGAVGGIPGAMVGAAIPTGIGNVARAISNRSTERQISKFDEMVRSRSPLAESQSVEVGSELKDPAIAAIIRALLEAKTSDQTPESVRSIARAMQR